MQKPKIFFSHSSKDKEFISFLKKSVLNKTSDTVEIFSSSDGESIPFGNNWVSQIESNLNNAKLMFVFVSPNSLKSNWIYFESGFSYSKGVRVVPIGINGVDIGILSPPINLLQGFNITSFEGLNNILTVINREFLTSFPLRFNDEDYKNLSSKSNNVISSNFLMTEIDYLATGFPKLLDGKELTPNALEHIEVILQTNNIKYSKDRSGHIYLNGMLISSIMNVLDFKIDVNKIDQNIKLINQALEVVYNVTPTKFWIYIYFNESIDLVTSDFKLSSRLKDVGIERSEDSAKLYNFKNLLFAIDDKSASTRKSLRVVYHLDSLYPNEIFELIDILFNLNIIWRNDKP